MQYVMKTVGFLLIGITIVYSAPTLESNGTALILPTSSNSTNVTSESPAPQNGTTSNSTLVQRLGKFLGISIGLDDGLYGPNPYPFGQPYPCTVYGYPAPYAPPGTYPCGRPYYFG